MPGLPKLGEAFPDNSWGPAFHQYAANAAWWTGDQQALQSIYANVSGQTRGDDPATHYNKADRTLRRGGVRGWMARFFNGTPVSQDGEYRTRLHAPVAANLATLSSDLLFAEPPTFRLVDEDGEVIDDKAQTRLDRILNSEAAILALSDAAELTAGISATVLTAHWDRNISDRPWLQATACDAAVPEFAAGRLVAVNLFTEYHELRPTDRAVVDRTVVHIERHEPGAVVHALARLKANPRGDIVVEEYLPLSAREETAHIAEIPGAILDDPWNGAVRLPTGVKGLTAAWWRNRPTRLFRKNGGLAMMGRSDFEGAEQLLDAVDETWSSWMRDLKIARARLIVPNAFLDSMGPGMGGAFDTDREILTALEFTDLGGDGGNISAHQFAIRAQEHSDTLHALTREITQFAGYSMSTYGESGATAQTATEVVDRTTLTERTRDKKLRIFAEAIRPLAMTLLELDRVHFGGPGAGKAADLDIDWPDLSQIDPEKEARTFQYLRAAMAVSTETLVRAQHEDWSEAQIEAEVNRVQSEFNLDDSKLLADDAANLDRAPLPADGQGDGQSIDGQAGTDLAGTVADQQAVAAGARP
jgi:hypothetical protein